MLESYPLPLAWQIEPACHRAGIGRTKLYQLIKDGEIKTIKVGRRTLVPESELQKWLANKLDQVGA
jgi:excisionase family DNA binding protein